MQTDICSLMISEYWRPVFARLLKHPLSGAEEHKSCGLLSSSDGDHKSFFNYFMHVPFFEWQIEIYRYLRNSLDGFAGDCLSTVFIRELLRISILNRVFISDSISQNVGLDKCVNSKTP